LSKQTIDPGFAGDYRLMMALVFQIKRRSKSLITEKKELSKLRSDVSNLCELIGSKSYGEKLYDIVVSDMKKCGLETEKDLERFLEKIRNE